MIPAALEMPVAGAVSVGAGAFGGRRQRGDRKHPPEARLGSAPAVPGRCVLLRK